MSFEYHLHLHRMKAMCVFEQWAYVDRLQHVPVVDERGRATGRTFALLSDRDARDLLARAGAPSTLRTAP